MERTILPLAWLYAGIFLICLGKPLAIIGGVILIVVAGIFTIGAFDLSSKGR